MYCSNPYLAQRLAEERIKDALREAEQYRLIRRATRGSRKARPNAIGVVLKGLANLLASWR